MISNITEKKSEKKAENSPVAEYISYFCAVVLSFIISLQSNSNIFVYREQKADSAVFQYVAGMMLKGYMPYRDAFDHKGPLLYFINAVGLLICKTWGIWLVEFLFLAVAFIFLYRTFRLWTGRVFSVLALMLSFASFSSYFYGGNFSEEYSVPFIAISLYIFIDYFKNDKISNLRLILCGASFACVLLLRPNNAGVWPVLCLCVLIHCIYKKMTKDLIRFILYFICGMAVVIIPVMVWLLCNGIFGDFIECYIRFNMLYSEAGFSDRINGIKLFLMDYPVLMSVLICLFFALKNKSIRAIGHAGLIFSTLAFIALPGTMFTHYGLVLVPVIMVPYAVVLSGIDLKKKQTVFDLGQYALLVFSVLIIISPDSRYVYQRAVFDISHSGEVFNPTSYQYIVAYSDHFTGPDDRVVYFGNCDRYYLLTDRTSATRFSYQTPIFDHAGELGWSDEYFAKLENDPPKLIGVLTPKTTICDRDRIELFVREHDYELVLTTDDLNMYVLPDE
ncbi:MAG: glycosyltransferase family 39 protein [Lachnospiraceae bacterium]|nr:glycosyltransferase family 39 protein [Lachnospiraceae bacterium]